MATGLAFDPRFATSLANTMLADRSKAVPSTSTQAKARQTAEDFEAVFLNTMMQSMFAGLDGEGPLGGSGASGVWRSFLTDEYAKGIAKAGGIGIADHVYRSLIAHQEAAQK
jgi:peptidoglycan hydrolase FlgJ